MSRRLWDRIRSIFEPSLLFRDFRPFNRILAAVITKRVVTITIGTSAPVKNLMRGTNS